MLNAETMKRMIEAEYKSTVDFATKRRDDKLSAVAVLVGGEVLLARPSDDVVMCDKPAKKKRSPSKLADSIRRWVANGSPKEFTANDCADAIGADRSKTQIVVHGLSHSPYSGVRIVRREYAPRRNIYGKAK